MSARTCASPDCRTKLNSHNHDPYCYACQDSGKVPTTAREYLCKICGATITGARGWKRYCGDACRNEGRRRNERTRRDLRVRSDVKVGS